MGGTSVSGKISNKDGFSRGFYIILFNKSIYTLGIFIDLTKAFDTCDIDILLKKLDDYGFRGISNQWFENYLKGRKQFTSIKGVNSSLEDILCGVPHGSILGPN